MDFSRYKYQFVDYGWMAQDELPAGTVMVDAGNRLCPGIFDHHQLSRDTGNGRLYHSTSELVCALKHLLPEKADTFITHRRPDFDAWLSIWLIQYYLENGAFPENRANILSYASRLDSGDLNVDPDNIRTPVAVAAAIPFLFLDEPRERQDAGILMRGLQLIDYLFRRTAGLPDTPESLELPWFIERNAGFEKEIQLAAEDLDLYEQDVRDPAYTEKTKLLLRNTAARSYEYADALIWKRIPRCRLHKHWARTDNRAPQGKGYILTFIPQGGDCDVRRHGDVVYNRAIISVNPTGPFDLYGLAIELERLELMKEESVYKDRPELSRMEVMKAKGLKPRFREAWCKHDDPWYDGRSDGYTIVDSPRRGSLLELDEMIRIVKTFTVPEVRSARTRIIYPFSFHTPGGATGFTLLADRLRSRHAFTETGFQSLHVPEDAFYPYIRDYLNLSGLSDSPAKRNCRIFAPSRPSEAPNGLMRILLFSYGIGFYITEYADLCEDSVSFQPKHGMDELLRHNHNAAGRTSIAEDFIKDLAEGLPLNVTVDEGVIYSCIEVREEVMGPEQTQKTIYQICNLKSYRADETSVMQDDMEYTASRKDSYVLQVNRRIVYGFGKGGGCLLIKTNDNDHEGVNLQNRHFKERFMTVDFISFLLSLHQRICMISLTKRLSEYAGNRRNVAMVRRLQYFIMDFMAKGWFSQVSRNELNVEIYARWGCVLENECLYREVSVQLKSYEDYLNAERNRKISLISSIFVPAALLDIFFSINLLGKSQNTELIGNIPWYISLGLLIVLFLSMILYLSRGKSRKKL